MNNNTILETLKLQPLTEEEKERRHILGRWYGPIATCLESTRNGRKYNRQLWEKALNDELFHEKLENKCLFLELGHPADREETDMRQVCACIPEMPKIINGDLCACVDILDTPNGRILKTLCDYGFIPGISSRGSGDVMANDEVDPETFFLECFDVVAIPAVKKARLSMCESLDKNSIGLKRALTESLNKASDEDKAIMKETLENLNIDLEDELNEKESSVKVLTPDDVPWDPEAEDILVEDTEESDMEELIPDENAGDDPSEEVETEDDENDEAVEAEEESDEDIPDVNTVGDVVELLQEYDDDMRIEFEPIEINGQEVEVDRLSHFIDDEDKDDPILVIGVGCEEADLEKLEADFADENIETEVEDKEISDEEVPETDNTEESAEDNGEAEVFESLKEMIRQKEALEAEVSDLRKAKSVGDAKEQELQEKLIRYKKAFKQTSAEAAKIPELQSKIEGLTEQLAQSKTKIKTLTEKVNNTQQLKESIAANKSNEKRLTESVNRLTEANKTLEAKLEGQTKQYTQKLQERTELAKTYKARFLETLNKYVAHRAQLLGVRPSEITSRLNENYTLADVDAVCDQILDSTVNFSRLPFGGRSKASARISESVSRPTRKEPEYGYEIDDSLYELAGLKK